MANSKQCEAVSGQFYTGERLSCTLEEGGIAVLTMHCDDNRLNQMFVDEFMAAMDAIEADETVQALVVGTAHEKIFSNGIDLEWVMAQVAENNLDGLKNFFVSLGDFLKRLVSYPLPTVAAIGGHVCAGGAIMACCFDFRIMRSDRGYFFFNEVDTGIPFWPGMVAVCRRVIPEQVLTDMMLLGRRLTGPECLEYRMVSKACPKEELMDETLQFARGIAKQRKNYSAQKQRLVAPVIKVMEEEDPSVIESGQLTA